MSTAPYSKPMPRVKAPYLFPKVPQKCTAPEPGITLLDMLEPRCAANLTSCTAKMFADMSKINTHPGETRWRPKACAYSPTCLLPRYRGCVWDLRDPTRVVPLDYAREQPTHLNLDFYRVEMEGHPDQELLSHMIHGVRFLADLEHQFVIMPHLLSLGKAFPSVQKELRRLRGLKWVEFYCSPPFWPMRASPQGCTPRKYEDRWRRTSDASAPHTPLFDCASQPIFSLNTASQRPRVVDGIEYPIPKEHKPTLRQAMRNLAILLHVASLTGEQVFLFTDDVADYFNQLRLAAEEEWKSVVVTLSTPGDATYDVSRGPELRYVNERVLGFGTTRSSNYAQRHTNLLKTPGARNCHLVNGRAF